MRIPTATAKPSADSHASAPFTCPPCALVFSGIVEVGAGSSPLRAGTVVVGIGMAVVDTGNVVEVVGGIVLVVVVLGRVLEVGRVGIVKPNPNVVVVFPNPKLVVGIVGIVNSKVVEVAPGSVAAEAAGAPR